MRYMIILNEDTLQQTASEYVLYSTLHESEDKAVIFYEKNLSNDTDKYVIVGITEDQFNKLINKGTYHVFN